MKREQGYFEGLRRDLEEAARKQDRYDLTTINLIAPASPTPLKYFHNTVLRHNSIAEGLLGHRPYAGVEGFNRIEQIAVELACKLFGAEHANVQPHSVSQANQAVYQGLLEYGDRVLAMNFKDGGHLTHGLKQNFSGKFYNFSFYGVDENTGLLNYEQIRKQALELKPKIIVCGGSSYPRVIDFEKLASIAKESNSYLMADLSHPAGLIVGNKFPQPFPHCDIVTLTLDKTMLGPHGGIILCRNSLSSQVDKAVHPGVQSSVPLRRIYEMAECLIDCTSPWFQEYIDRVIRNIKVFEREFNKYPELMITGGSDTHLLVLNTYKTFNLTGVEAEKNLEEVGILTNRQVIPGEKLKPYVTSGIRLGTSWITARGYSEEEVELIAKIIINNLKDPNNSFLKENSRQKLYELAKKSREKDIWKDEKI